MSDAQEGLDRKGFIKTGVDRAHLEAPFIGVIDDAATSCAAVPGFHSLYVYGSVSTGTARVGDSDLDLLMVAETKDVQQTDEVEERLSRRHSNVVRQVSIAIATANEIFAHDGDGLAWRCFLKHYCVCVAGADLTVDLPLCRPSAQLVAGLTADTRPVLEKARADAESPDVDVNATARAVARKLLLTGAALVSMNTGTWTTDRSRAAQELMAAHPERTHDVERALRWADPRGVAAADRAELRDFVDGFGRWLLRELEAALESG